MIRKQITFEVKGEALIALCSAKLAHHGERLAYWTNLAAELEAALLSKGVSVVRSQVRANTTYSGHGAGMRVRVDHDMETELDEATDKVREHQGLVDDYDRWMRAFASEDPERAYDLDVDDLEYFAY